MFSGRRGQGFYLLSSSFTLLCFLVAFARGQGYYHEGGYHEEVVYEVDQEIDVSELGVAPSALTNCGSHTGVDGSRFNLASLTTVDGYNASNIASGTYLWNFCASLPAPGNGLVPLSCNSAASSAYAYRINGTGCFVIGAIDIPPAFMDGMNGPGSGVQIIYKTSAGCMTIVRVNCNAQINYVRWTTVIPTPANCTFTITVQAKNGCKLKVTPSESGLSGGSIFLIVFFVGLATYFLLGALIKWRLMGTPAGVDMIPNVEFWTELPGYILDGFRFTRGKIFGICGKSYDNV